MPVALSRQDAQTMIDQARNRIMEQMVNKYEIRGAVDNARDKLFSYINDYEQQRSRVNATQHSQLTQKMNNLDGRLRSLETEIAALAQMIGQSLSRQNQIVDQTRRITSNGNDSIAILQRALQ